MFLLKIVLVFKLEKLFWKRNQSFSEAMEEEFFESYNWDLDEHQRNDLNLFAFKFYSLIKCFSYCICIQKIGWGFKVFLYILYRLPSKYESFKVDNRALRFTLLVIWMSLDIEHFMVFFYGFYELMSSNELITILLLYGSPSWARSFFLLT